MRFTTKEFVKFLNLQNGFVAVETDEGSTVIQIRECCAPATKKLSSIVGSTY
jgi:hypothetical protein